MDLLKATVHLLGTITTHHLILDLPCLHLNSIQTLTLTLNRIEGTREEGQEIDTTTIDPEEGISLHLGTIKVTTTIRDRGGEVLVQDSIDPEEEEEEGTMMDMGEIGTGTEGEEEEIEAGEVVTEGDTAMIGEEETEIETEVGTMVEEEEE